MTAKQVRSVRVDDSQWRQLSELAQSHGLTRNGLVQLFIDATLDGSLDVDRLRRMTAYARKRADVQA